MSELAAPKLLEEHGPFVVVAVQECTRMNVLLQDSTEDEIETKTDVDSNPPTTCGGPTYVFLATLGTDDPVSKWVLAGVAMVFQDEAGLTISR